MTFFWPCCKHFSDHYSSFSELQLLADHHFCKQGSEDESTPQSQNSVDNRPNLGCCCHGNTAPIHASQQMSSCRCFMQDGQQENNSPGRQQDSQLDSSEGKVYRSVLCIARFEMPINATCSCKCIVTEIN